jgi:hypothetical protein
MVREVSGSPLAGYSEFIKNSSQELQGLQGLAIAYRLWEAEALTTAWAILTDGCANCKRNG